MPGEVERGDERAAPAVGTAEEAPYLLEMRNITKDFPGVRALDNVSLTLAPGEVHALAGENGAGKSTLIKILAGAERMTSGEILIGGGKVDITGPLQAKKLGISVIYQEFDLIPFLSVAENILLGREPRKGAFIDWPALHSQAGDAIRRLGIDLDLRAVVNSLSVAQKQMTEIAKAVSTDARIIVMDEPTATLTLREQAHLFDLVRTLKKQGVAIIYISHRLEELFEIADRVTVLRDGKWVMTAPVKEVTREQLVKHMVGRELTGDYPRRTRRPGREILSVRGLSRRGVIHDVSFSLREGEVLGITGLVGSGRTEIARAIFGADPADAGEVRLAGERLYIKDPRAAIRAGISLATEDRKEQGLVLMMSVRENVTLANLRALVRRGFVSRRRESAEASRLVHSLAIKTSGLEQKVQNLSGGNQQKVVLAKWLFTNSRVVIFDEPTRGIDVGAKQEIYRLMNDLAEQGVGIIMISSELPEVLGMSDRILVIHEGRVRAELTQDEATQEKIMSYATGGPEAVSGRDSRGDCACRTCVRT
ncbi:MAG: sugar ABC transporter ATP-binding protein [Firmicutes bacterium]|jgi:ribose transport system ATP-binding protein|nr:sugar ABC transporter ATP-binding protein [Bacillota bacterium]MDH7495889.1 sugar ABC transporter ATP-binding protein [Bacillota bacterium]